MANIKISELTAAASASGTQEFEVNDSGVSKKVTGAQIASFVEAEVSSSPSFTGDVTIADKIVHDGDTNTAIRFPAADTVTIETAGSERVRVTSAGKVGIGTSSPTHNLDVVGVGDTALHITATSSGAGNDDDAFLVLDCTETGEAVLSFRQDGVEKASIDWFSGGGPDWNFSTAAGTGANFDFQPEGSLAMRINSSGNVGIGTSSPSTKLHVIRDLPTAGSDSVSIFDRTTSTGDVIRFRKDGTTVGYIGVGASNPYIGSGDVTLVFTASGDAIVPAGTDAATRSGAIDLGNSANKWDTVFATVGTINTSDRTEKQDIEELNDAERRVAVACKGLLRKYRLKSAVALKGEDARIHFGIIAQDLQAAFAAEGLDAGRYGMFIHSTWTDEETGEEKSLMGVRYSELLAFIIAAL